MRHWKDVIKISIPISDSGLVQVAVLPEAKNFQLISKKAMGNKTSNSASGINGDQKIQSKNTNLQTKGSGRLHEEKKFSDWSIEEVKQWIEGWNTQFNESQKMINVIDKYQINGVTLLYLTKNDLLEFGVSNGYADIFMKQMTYLHNNPTPAIKPNTKNHKTYQSHALNANDNEIESAEKELQTLGRRKTQKKSRLHIAQRADISTTTFTEGYLNTKGPDVYICLQTGDIYIKMAINPSCTVYQLKQQYIKGSVGNIHGSHTLNNPKEVCVELLNKWGLGEYKKVFIEDCGYDNVMEWANLTINDLKDVTFKTAHARKLIRKTKQYLAGQNTNHGNIRDIVLLFMGKELDDKVMYILYMRKHLHILNLYFIHVQKTLSHYKIGYTNVTTIFVAHRIKSQHNSGQAAGILFLNNHDNSQNILYVDITMTILELKKIYKNYLIKQFKANQMKKNAQTLSEQRVSFRYSGKKFPDNSTLKDCGIGNAALQYIFVSFGSIRYKGLLEEKETEEDAYINKTYQITPKEHEEIITITKSFTTSKKSNAFQKSVKEIAPTFKAVSKSKLDQIKAYPQIQDIAKELTSDDNRKANEYTKKVLNTPPTGKLGQDLNTTLHVLSNIFKSTGEECVFYDSRKGVKLMGGDSGCAFHEAFEENKPFTLRLKNMEGLYGVTDDDMKDDTNKLIEMQSAIDNNIEHPTLSHVKTKLSAALGVRKDRIRITEVFAGSDCFKYTVDSLTFQEKQRMIQGDPTQRLAQQFRQFKELKIHPLLFRPAFDVRDFDVKGNKSFVSLSNKYQIGPENMKKEYTQPTGWTRYGLKVLGKYGDDKWLEPFNDPGNWWRAFHGTARAAVYKADPRDAMAKIHKHGFLPAKKAAYGPGVYCSPKATEAEGTDSFPC